MKRSFWPEGGPANNSDFERERRERDERNLYILQTIGLAGELAEGRQLSLEELERVQVLLNTNPKIAIALMGDYGHVPDDEFVQEYMNSIEQLGRK